MKEIDMLDQHVSVWMRKEPAMERQYSVVLADRYDRVRQEVRRIIEAMGGIRVVGEASSALQLLEILKNKIPDMVIVDISMPSLRDIEAIRKIKALYNDIKLIFLSIHENKEYLNYALGNGADGFIFKLNLDMELCSAIEKIRKGEIFISPILAQG
jgi:two-component system response regulator NreC